MVKQICSTCDDETEHDLLADVIGDVELKYGVFKCKICGNEFDEMPDDERTE